ncbi:hypothetical protein NC652_035691 [Populus alba x Populus x berolinensis]|nr:hypothetical protein NC652_035691 [Populus alba x Populus x berolinensis]
MANGTVIGTLLHEGERCWGDSTRTDCRKRRPQADQQIIEYDGEQSIVFIILGDPSSIVDASTRREFQARKPLAGGSDGVSTTYQQ